MANALTSFLVGAVFLAATIAATLVAPSMSVDSSLYLQGTALLGLCIWLGTRRQTSPIQSIVFCALPSCLWWSFWWAMSLTHGHSHAWIGALASLAAGSIASLISIQLSKRRA